MFSTNYHFWGAFFYFMKKIEWARWSTPKEIDQLKQWFTTNNSSEGLGWLAKNKDKVVDDHNKFIKEYYSRKLKKAKERHKEYLVKAFANNEEVERVFNKLKDGEKIQCICKGNLRLVPYNGSHFIGCDNFREKVEHSKFYYKNDLNDFSLGNFDEYFEYPKHYLSSIIKEYNYPKYVKASNFYEFLKINGIQLATHIDEETFYRVSLAAKKSRDREKIIKPILEKIFDKVWHQLHITVKYEGENQRIKIPDFICKRNDMLYIFEQKKSVENCMDDQLDEYVDLVKYITKNDSINGYFIVEEETDNEFFKEITNYFTIKTLQNEFN
jgi:prophage maintenance system killer protein